MCRCIVKKIKALLKRFGAPGALQYLTFFFLTGATFFVVSEEGKADGIGAARAAAAAAVAAALTPPALASAVALLGGPKVKPPGGGATGGRWPKVAGGGGCGGPAATGAAAGAGSGAGAGAGAVGATSTTSSCLWPVPVLMVDESVSTLTPYLDDMSPVACMSLGTSMDFRFGRFTLSMLVVLALQSARRLIVLTVG